MKRLFLTTLVLCGFFALSVFGTMPIVHGETGHTICASAYGKSANCPLGQNPIDFASFHLNALRSFSTAIFSVESIILTLIFTLLFGLFVSRSLERKEGIPLLVSIQGHVADNIFRSEEKYCAWLSIFEKRDPA